MSESKRGFPGDLSETPTTAELFEVALAIQQCAKSWVPEARLIGNVRAGDIATVIRDYLNLRLEKGISKNEFIHQKGTRH